MASRSENNIQTIYKDPVMKWCLRIVVFIVIIILIVLLVKMATGRYMNLWGLEVNKKEADTVIVRAPGIVSHDTIRIEAPAKEKLQSPANSSVTKKENKTADTVSIVQGKNVNTGTNSGVIGDNNIFLANQNRIPRRTY